MNPKISVITLGVNDLDKAFAFYQKGLGFPSKDGIQFDGDLRIAFFQLKGTWLSLFERRLLAKDANVKMDGIGFPGFSLGHMVDTLVKWMKLLLLRLRPELQFPMLHITEHGEVTADI